jgi:hypothetical protein
MLFDVSAVKAKERARMFAASFDGTQGPAGIAKTRRETPLLTDKQSRLIDQFVQVVPRQSREHYRSAVHARLSGAVGDSAVRASCIQSAKGIVELQVLREAGLITIDSSGGAKLPSSLDQYRIPGGSKEVNGLVRKYRRIVK